MLLFYLQKLHKNPYTVQYHENYIIKLKAEKHISIDTHEYYANIKNDQIHQLTQDCCS